MTTELVRSTMKMMAEGGLDPVEINWFDMTGAITDLAGAGLLCVPSVAHAGKFAKVNSATMKYEGVRYFRTRASEARLGSLGVKKTPVGAENYFLHQQDAPNGIYKVHVGAAVTISNQEYHEYEANFGVRAGASNSAMPSAIET